MFLKNSYCYSRLQLLTVCLALANSSFMEGMHAKRQLDKIVKSTEGFDTSLVRIREQVDWASDMMQGVKQGMKETLYPGIEKKVAWKKLYSAVRNITQADALKIIDKYLVAGLVSTSVEEVKKYLIEQQKAFADSLSIEELEYHSYPVYLYLVSKGMPSAPADKIIALMKTLTPIYRKNSIIQCLSDGVSVDINIRDPYGRSLLHWAGEKGDSVAIEEGLALGLDIQSVDLQGRTALHYGARNNQAALILLLCRSYNPKIDCKSNDGYTPLHDAVSFRANAASKVLLSSGAEVNALNYLRESPLHKAAAHGYDDIATLLIENGADLYSKCKKGMTPLHTAAQHARLPIIKLLISTYKVDPTERSADGRTLLHYAAGAVFTPSERAKAVENALVDFKEVLSLCGSQKAIFMMQDNSGLTALHCALVHKRIDHCKALLEHVRSFSSEEGELFSCVRDNNGDTALHYAIKGGCKEVVELLKSAVNCSGDDREALTPFDCALLERRENLIELLVGEAQEIERADVLQLAKRFCFMDELRYERFLKAARKTENVKARAFLIDFHKEVVAKKEFSAADQLLNDNNPKEEIDGEQQLWWMQLSPLTRPVEMREAVGEEKSHEDEEFDLVAMHRTYGYCKVPVVVVLLAVVGANVVLFMV